MKLIIALCFLGMCISPVASAWAEEDDTVLQVEEAVSTQSQQGIDTRRHPRMNAKDRAKAKKNRKRDTSGFSALGDKKSMPAFSEQKELPSEAVVVNAAFETGEDSNIDKQGRRIKNRKFKHHRGKKGIKKVDAVEEDLSVSE